MYYSGFDARAWQPRRAPRLLLKKLPKPTAAPTQELKPESIVFNDAALEAKVRAAMNKPEGDITAGRSTKSVTELVLSNEWQPEMPEDQKIRDISALKYFANLIKLQLTFNAVTDISALSGLTQLKILDLGGNSVGDLSPLTKLTNLTDLSLFGNGLTRHHARWRA